MKTESCCLQSLVETYLAAHERENYNQILEYLIYLNTGKEHARTHPLFFYIQKLIKVVSTGKPTYIFRTSLSLQHFPVSQASHS